MARNAALLPKLHPTGVCGRVTQAVPDSLVDLPDISRFVPNPDRAYDWARVFVDFETSGDVNASVDARFGVGVRVDDLGESDTDQQVKGWIAQSALATTGTVIAPLTVGSAEATHRFITPDLTEGQYAIEVPVYGMDLWMAVGGVVGYTYAYGWTVTWRVVWYNKNGDEQQQHRA